MRGITQVVLTQVQVSLSNLKLDEGLLFQSGLKLYLLPQQENGRCPRWWKVIGLEISTVPRFFFENVLGHNERIPFIDPPAAGTSDESAARYRLSDESVPGSRDKSVAELSDEDESAAGSRLNRATDRFFR